MDDRASTGASLESLSMVGTIPTDRVVADGGMTNESLGDNIVACNSLAGNSLANNGVA